MSHNGRPRPGTLKIYLGAAPGVGKTCAMLNEAQALQASGKKVLVGIVEDHGRTYTRQLAEGLPRQALLPGVGRGELNVAGVLAAAPQVAVVDEFAHSNPTGARHAKRWGDVQELLDAGIDVISTMNIQHLESLNDVVSEITGITQQETVPDEVVRAADTIELVDISPEFLRTRLSDGHVYSAERIGPALNNYFRLGNLTALRELALLWLADQVDDALNKYRTEQHITDTWETKERVVVAVENAAHAEPLIRRGRRIATKSSAELLVVHVISGDSFTTGNTATLARLQELAEDVGAKLHQVTGDTVPEALLNFARAANATQLVLGATPRRRYARLLGESVAEAVLRNSGKIDCHMVNLPLKSRSRVRALFQLPSTGWLGIAWRWLSALVAPALLTVLLEWWGAQDLGTGTIAAFYFALILAMSLVAGLGPALLTAVVSGLVVNWYFTPPLHTFNISEPANAVVLVVMVATAFAVGILVQRAQQERLRAAGAARDAELLTIFSRAALGEEPVERLLAKVAEAFGCSSAAVRDPAGVELARWDSIHGPTGGEVTTHVDAHNGQVRLTLVGPAPAAKDRALVLVVADYLAGVFWQQALAREAARADAIAAADDLRRALLASVGHDLRTPLATAKLAVSSLRSSEVEFSAQDREDLLVGVEESIDQLTDLVTNLLDSSRLAAGAVTARRDVVSIAEVVHRAVASCSFGASVDTMRRVVVDPSVRIQCVADAALLERVVANLVDNALRYSTGLVWISGQLIDASVLLTVSDTGPGVTPDMHEKMFQPFQRLGDTNNDNGVGLGLSVVKGFVEAMNGSVTVLDGPGAAFVVRLPAETAAAEEGGAGGKNTRS
ncbi:osmosensitive K+ channel histidine kinase [Corynebacterium epidermidicanis]|uniref:histidine kinase n=2 Tax=Corynebacterium epidermidicanis TaxID=1050174 RepID=A0A0G3GSU1_9CORY|nr:osmosensitive K+ channel histidine kinase [Corynebacterium epidermidicanis]